MRSEVGAQFDRASHEQRSLRRPASRLVQVVAVLLIRFPTSYGSTLGDGCDTRAVSEPGVPARQGDNPDFIDGIRCFRRYKIGGWLSQRDTLGCDDYDEFYDTHYDDSGPIHTFNQPDPPR
jgi:hypothetical protein